MSVWELYTQLFAKGLKMRKICTKFVPRMLRKYQKEKRCHDSRGMLELINSDHAVLDVLVTCDESWIYCIDQRPRDRVPSGYMLALPDPRRPDRANPPTKILMIPFFDSTGMIYMHSVPTGLTDNKEYYVEVLREVQEEIPSEDASNLQIVSVAFPPGQCTSPQLHPRHRLFDQDGHQDSSSHLPIVQTLLPVTLIIP